MYPCFEVDGISDARPRGKWKWPLMKHPGLLATNAFGDLFLNSALGIVHRRP